jgi:homoserine dehydrogenase
MNKIRIGLFGYGIVAKALVEQIQKEHDTRLDIRKICVRTWKEDYNDDPRFTVDPRGLLESPEIDVLVELTSSSEEPKAWMAEAFRINKPFITANKRSVAESLNEINARGLRGKVPLLYEAAAAAALPVIRSIDGRAWHDNHSSIEGVLNGSTNFILSKMGLGFAFEEALREAQELGFAEADPSFDVESIDPAFKLSILLYHSFGAVLSVEDIPHYGISRITTADLEFARLKGKEIKVLAKAELKGNSICARVGPTLVNGRYSAVANERNAVLVSGDRFGDLYFEGRGAGGHATAQAIIGDIYQASQGYSYTTSPIRILANAKAEPLGFYLRYQKTAEPNLNGVHNLELVDVGEFENTITGRLPLSDISERSLGRGKGQFLMFLE